MSSWAHANGRRPARPIVAVSNASTLANRTGSWKYIRPSYHDRVAPCNAGCPVGIDIEGYMNLLREGRVVEAGELLLDENPMPAVTGRVCDHPCEASCNRRHFDESVSIHAVERMLGDLLLEARPSERAPTRGKTVAIIGSGPAGLACAYHLARFGYEVTVFEEAAEPGGMLRLGIPEYRLPRNVLDGEIDRIRALGVKIECGVAVGTDLTWDALAAFDAVFVAVGAHRARPLGIAEESVPAVQSGLDFLKRVNRGARPDLGRRVIVVGGGNTAIDCARTALRLGSEPVVLYRRTRNEMPAIAEEIAEAEREGVQFTFLAAPRATRTVDGTLRGLECVRMRLGQPDESGRRRPIPTEEGQFSVQADTVLSAIGEVAKLEFLPGDIAHTEETVRTDELGETNHPLVFAGGDVTDQTRSVAWALGSGKRAAIGIDRALTPRVHDASDSDEIAGLRFGKDGNVSAARWLGNDRISRTSPINDVVELAQLNLSHFALQERHADRFLSGWSREHTFTEVNRGLDRNTAQREANRCFNCGVCNQCELCLIFCPDIAISRRPDGGGFEIDMDHCKGCGICAAECPRGAMTMTREGLL